MNKIIGNIDLNMGIAKVTLHRVFDRHGIAAEIFGALGQHGFNIEAISTTQLRRNRADISFAVREPDLEPITRILQSIKDRFGAKTIGIDKDRALIGIYGSEQFANPGMVGRIFSKFAELGINIEMISASLSTLTIVIKKDKADQAVEAIKKEFAVQ